MNATNKTSLVIAFAIAAVLLLLFGGGTMTGATMSGGMMGNGAMGGIGWMWIPTLLVLGLGVLLAWVVFGQKKWSGNAAMASGLRNCSTDIFSNKEQ